jgi:uncharacterized protein YbcI
MADQTLLKGGELNAAITSALVGIQTEYLGRGPRSASTFHYGHVLVTLMHEVLTPAEKSLTRTNQTDAVGHIRHLFQETMAADFREAVERLTGRKVVAFISGNHLDPDIAAELFILDAPLNGPARSDPGSVDSGLAPSADPGDIASVNPRGTTDGGRHARR